MRHRVVRYILNALLLAAAIVVILTGVVVDRLELNHFAPHRWAGYAVAVLIGIHVALHWRWFFPSRSNRRHRPGPGAPQPVGPAAEPVGPQQQPPVGKSETGLAGAAATVGSPPSDLDTGVGRDRAKPTRRTAIAAVGAGMAGAVVGWSTRAEVSANPYAGGDVGLFYHRESSLGLRDLLGDLLDWGRRPDPYLRLGGQVVPLPALGAAPGMTVAQALESRRSLRSYADRALTAQELAWVIHAATGITSAQGHRSAPSAGALYPVETYVVVTRVDGIDRGVYHVDVRDQALEPVRSGSVAGDLMVAGLGQDFLRRAPVVLVLTGLFQRSRWKYGQRHYRYVCWEGGHVAQNVYLAAESIGLGACMVGSFLDGMVNDLIAVDGRREAALGLIALGPRAAADPS